MQPRRRRERDDALAAPRGLFDGFDAAGRAPPERSQAARSAPEAPAFTVSELTAEIQNAVALLGRVRVEGEVSDLRQPGSGHVYFQLKDASARLACAIWKSQLARIALEPREGDLVVAHGRLDVYAPRGSYSLIVERLEPVGIGALLARLEALKRELGLLGWFARKRPIPAEPRRIGVVTSRDGAALRDFLRTRSLRWPGYPVRLAHASVQGASAAREIAAALDALAGSGDVDLIVLCRGGGSLEDLWAFNERVVAEAIWRSRVPVISGVGHETDTTLADLVADLRAHTPTDAAQQAIPDRALWEARLAAAGEALMRGFAGGFEARAERLRRAAARRVLRNPAWIAGDRAAALVALGERAGRALSSQSTHAEGRLAALHARLERRNPAAVLARAEQRLEEARGRLARGVERRLERARGKLAEFARGLVSTNPLAVLARGYSVTSDTSGRTLTDASAVARGDALVTRLARGRLVSRVERVEPGE